MFIQRPAPEERREPSEDPISLRQPADLDKAALAVEVARAKVAEWDEKIYAAIAAGNHDLESRCRGQARVARQILQSMELHKSRMES